MHVYAHSQSHVSTLSTKGEVKVIKRIVKFHGTFTNSPFLRRIFEDTLKWDLNATAITKKGHQGSHLHQKLQSFNVVQLL